MIRRLKDILKTIVFEIKAHKAWKILAPSTVDEPQFTLGDRIQVICILAYIKKQYTKEDNPEELDVELREGIKLYCLNDRVIKALSNKGYMICMYQREYNKAQSYQIW